MVPSRLIFNEPERCAAWAQTRLPNFVGWAGYYQAIGREVEGELVGVVVYTCASPRNVMTSIVLERPMTRRFLKTVLWYPFEQLKVPRITAMVEEWNTKSRSFCEHVGFKLEGKLRRAAAGGGDVLVMGMLREECQWL